MPLPENPTVDDIRNHPGMKRAFEEYRRINGIDFPEQPNLDQVLSTPELRREFKHFATRSYGDTSFTTGGKPIQNDASFDLYNALEASEEFRRAAANGASVQELHRMAQSMVAQRSDDDLRTGYHLDPSGNGLNISATIIGKTLSKVQELGEVASGRSQEFRDAIASYNTLVSSGTDKQVLAGKAKEIYDTYISQEAPKKVMLPKDVQDDLSALSTWKPEEGVFTLDDDDFHTMFNKANEVVTKRMSSQSIAGTFDEMTEESRLAVILNDFNGSGTGRAFGYLKSDQFKQTLHTVKERVTGESLPGFKDSPLFQAALEVDANNRAICEAFNGKPKNGIQLIKDICGENGLSEEQTQQQIAAFLIQNRENLDLEGVGEYLSGPDKENQAVLQEFTSQLAPNMKGVEYTKALREYLDAFKLPGEAQKVDRMVQAFGKAYMQQNPKSGIANEDAAYVLSFQAIMLATDAHNPAVKNKMTLDQLTKNLRGTNNGKDFSPELLENFYKDLTQTPLANTAKKVPQSFVLDSAQLRTDSTLTKVTGEFSKKAFSAEKALGIEGATAKVNQGKPWYGGLTGYKSSVTITDKDGNQATLEMSKPGFFSKKEPTVTIKPVGKAGEEPSPGSVKLASQMAARFESQSTSVANYKYQRDEMSRQVVSEKQFLKTGVRVEESVPQPRVGKKEGEKVGVQKSELAPEELGRSQSNSVAKEMGVGPEKLNPEKPLVEVGVKKEPEVPIEEPKPKVELVTSNEPMKVREQLQGSVTRAKAKLAEQGLRDESQSPGGRKVGSGMK